MRILHVIFTLCIACLETPAMKTKAITTIQTNWKYCFGNTRSLQPNSWRYHFTKTPNYTGQSGIRLFLGYFAFNSGSNNVDTISFEQDLDYKISLRTGSYNLLFCAKDKATGIYAYERYNLTVGTETTDAWWVLKENSNGTDLDLITPTKTMPNFISSINGKQMAGAPVS